MILATLSTSAPPPEPRPRPPHPDEIVTPHPHPDNTTPPRPTAARRDLPGFRRPVVHRNGRRPSEHDLQEPRLAARQPSRAARRDCLVRDRGSAAGARGGRGVTALGRPPALSTGLRAQPLSGRGSPHDDERFVTLTLPGRATRAHSGVASSMSVPNGSRT